MYKVFKQYLNIRNFLKGELHDCVILEGVRLGHVHLEN